MKTGAKIAIGCAVVLVGAGLVAVVAVGGAAFWVRGKVQGLKESADALQTYQRQVDAISFTVPADGLLQEDRLVKYLNVRRQVFGVYEQNRAAIENMARLDEGKNDPGLSDMATIVKLASELRIANLKGLAAEQMSDSEYGWITGLLYQTAVATGSMDETGKQAGETIAEAMDQARESLREGLELASEAAEKAGAPAGSRPADADLKQLDAALEEMRGKTAALDVPPQNAALFKKYEADIQKYAMTGLPFLGL